MRSQANRDPRPSMTEAEVRLAKTGERLKQVMVVAKQLQKENEELKQQRGNPLAQNG